MSLPVKTLCINAKEISKNKNYKEYTELLKIIKMERKKFVSIVNKNKNKREYYLKRQISMNVYNKINHLKLSNVYFINENKGFILEENHSPTYLDLQELMIMVKKD